MTAERMPLLLSPSWLVLWDDFRDDRYAGPIRAELERQDGAAWVPDGSRPVVTRGRVLTYPFLGRCPEPWLRRATLHRVRVSAPGMAALYLADQEHFEDDFDVALDAREFTVPPYDDDHPPDRLLHPVEPELLRLVPAATYEYPPGTRVVRGVVRRAGGPGLGGPGLGGVLVQAVTPRGWRERTLTAPSGEFRLALRGRGAVAPVELTRVWPSAERFTLRAYESPNRSGSLDIRLERGRPAPSFLIEIRDQ